MAPLIPYVQIPDLTLILARLLGGFPPARVALKPFGTLVALGLYAGSACALRASRRLGVSERAMISFLTWIVLSSFFFGHVLDTLSYYPGEVLHDPLSLLRIWEGLSATSGDSRVASSAASRGASGTRRPSSLTPTWSRAAFR